MHGFGGKADEDAQVCLDVGGLSGVPSLDGEGASKIQACYSEGRARIDSVCWQVSHELWMRFRSYSSADLALTADSSAQAPCSYDMEPPSYRTQQK